MQLNEVMGNVRTTVLLTILGDSLLVGSYGVVAEIAITLLVFLTPLAQAMVEVVTISITNMERMEAIRVALDMEAKGATTVMQNQMLEAC